MPLPRSEAMRLIAQQLHASAEQNHATEQQHAAFNQSASYERTVSGSNPTSNNPFGASNSSEQSTDPLGATAAPGSAGNFLQTFFSSGKKDGVLGQSAPFNYVQQPTTMPPPPAASPPPSTQGFSYLGNRAAAPGAPVQTRGQLETDIIKSLLVSYYTIVRKNLQDAVPKAIMHFLVNSIRKVQTCPHKQRRKVLPRVRSLSRWLSLQDIQNELVAELYRENEFDEMLQVWLSNFS